MSISQIQNGDSGLTVRTSLNQVIDYVNSGSASYAVTASYVLNSSSSSNYISYVAILSQSGSNTPVVENLIQNDLGGAISWSYDGTGVYTGTLNGAFTLNKTLSNMHGVDYFEAFNIFSYRSGSNCIKITSWDSFGTPSEINGTASIEIKVYN